MTSRGVSDFSRAVIHSGYLCDGGAPTFKEAHLPRIHAPYLAIRLKYTALLAPRVLLSPVHGDNAL